jgi:hypothetical protein
MLMAVCINAEGGDQHEREFITLFGGAAARRHGSLQRARSSRRCRLSGSLTAGRDPRYPPEAARGHMLSDSADIALTRYGGTLG